MAGVTVITVGVTTTGAATTALASDSSLADRMHEATAQWGSRGFIDRMERWWPVASDVATSNPLVRSTRERALAWGPFLASVG